MRLIVHEATAGRITYTVFSFMTLWMSVKASCDLPTEYNVALHPQLNFNNVEHQLFVYLSPAFMTTLVEWIPFYIYTTQSYLYMDTVFFASLTHLSSFVLVQIALSICNCCIL